MPCGGSIGARWSGLCPAWDSPQPLLTEVTPVAPTASTWAAAPSTDMEEPHPTRCDHAPHPHPRKSCHGPFVVSDTGEGSLSVASRNGT